MFNGRRVGLSAGFRTLLGLLQIAVLHRMAVKGQKELPELGWLQSVSIRILPGDSVF
jgi:hypothetical protein